jgi:1-acyl-sn-glycerol-3-phosphate acyltransferase
MIYAIRYALCAVYTVFWSSLALPVAFLDRSGESVVWIIRQWIRWTLASCGVRVEREGFEHIDPRRSYVFMSNHQSVFDVAVIVHTLPVSFRFVAKKELTRIPFFGWALLASDHVIIDRGHREKSVRSLRRATERIRAGINVIIFPEGTRSPTGELREFKSGGFQLAIEAQAPILPVTVSGTQRITPKGSLRIESGVVKVVYGKPIETRGLGVEERKGLRDVVRRAIEQGYDPAFQGPRPIPQASGVDKR